VNYASGPAYVGFTFYDVGNASGNGAAKKVFTFGGSYDFGVVKVHALAQKLSGPSTLDALNIMAGVTVPIAGGNLMASYVRHNDRVAATDKDANQIGIGYQYPLSKRTALYTSFARIHNQHGAAFTVGNATETGTGSKAFNAGVVHNF
jgi:predicted porin